MNTLLTYLKKLLVRDTPEKSKKYSGDIKRAARIKEIRGIKAKEYKKEWHTNSNSEHNEKKKSAKRILQNFETVKKFFIIDLIVMEDKTKILRNFKYNINKTKNLYLNVKFSGRTVGGFRELFKVEKPNILRNLREIFDNSIYAYSSNYKDLKPRTDGSLHKNKDNIMMYHHFINKVKVNEETYYIRFVVEELKRDSQLHSVQVSKVSLINKKSRESNRSLLGKNQGGTAEPAHDVNLTYFLNSVKRPSPLTFLKK